MSWSPGSSKRGNSSGSRRPRHSPRETAPSFTLYTSTFNLFSLLYGREPLRYGMTTFWLFPPSLARARRLLQALADGETDPAALAALADYRLRALPEQLRDALGACQELNPGHRRLLSLALEQLHLIEQQINQLDQEMAALLRPHEDQVQRLAEVPGLGVDSAQQIMAEVGARAATFPSEGDLSFLGWRLPGRRGDRRSELQPPVPEGQPSYAAPSQSGCQRRGQAQRKPLRLPLSLLCATPIA